MDILPLTNNPEESFNISILGSVYVIRQLWNTLGYWSIDISDENNAPLVYGVHLVTQTNLLDQYANTPFDLRSEAVADPTRENLDAFNLGVIDKNV